MGEWTWKTKDGRELKLHEIDDNHLYNIYHMLCNRPETYMIGVFGHKDCYADEVEDTELKEDREVVKNEIEKRILENKIKELEKRIDKIERSISCQQTQIC